VALKGGVAIVDVFSWSEEKINKITIQIWSYIQVNHSLFT